MSEIAEILLAQIWNSQWFTHPLQASSGQSVRVIYPGLWSHGFGPDFRDAMVEIDNRLVIGDVEIEISPRNWYQHEHHTNDAFNNVVLQVVARDDGAPDVAQMEGKRIPRIILTNFLRGSLEEFPSTIGLRSLGTIGFEHCAPEAAETAPEQVLDILEHSGDKRMHARVTSMSGELAVSSPGQVLYARFLDAMGFSRNREPMGEIAARLQYSHLQNHLSGESHSERFTRCAAALLGVGGFLPFSPGDVETGRIDLQISSQIETEWEQSAGAWHGMQLPANAWNLARIRPASHPIRRLLAAAVILSASPDGLLESLVTRLETENPRHALNRWLVTDNPWLGKAHANEVVVNVVIPFALAYGEQARQPTVVDAAADLWAALPAGRGNNVTRRTLHQICGETTIRPRSARAEQGLIQIFREGCQQMRCFECPIAHLALHWSANEPFSSLRT